MIRTSAPNQRNTEQPRVPKPNVAKRGPTTSWLGRLTSSLLEPVVSHIVDQPAIALLLGVIGAFLIVPVLQHWPRGSVATTSPLVFLVPVVLASTLGGWWPGACVTVVAIGVWEWFFLPPAQSLGIDSADDLVTLVVYLAVAALVGHLSAAMRRRASAALQHETELTAVLDVTHAVASTLDVATVLGLVLKQVRRVIDCTSAAVLLQDGDRICIAGYLGPTPPEHVVGQSWPLSDTIVYRELVHRRAPIILADLRDASPMSEMFRRSRKIHVLGEEHELSWLWVPLLSKEQVVGVLSLSHREPHAFTERQAELALAIAHQVAVAIENARLYERSRETAAQEERSRLARELHDSVTQMLFSSSLIAEVLPRLWERDPEAARQSLEELRLLNRGASAEMRSLLVELRPDALAEARLEELLRQLAEAISARSLTPIQVTVEGDRPVPPDVQVALYRIAQEALTNAAKHAQARHIGVVLQFQPEGIELSICDDGRGFDPGVVRPGHFGLNTMRERSQEIGASLRVNSLPGKRTEVVVRWAE